MQILLRYFPTLLLGLLLGLFIAMGGSVLANRGTDLSKSIPFEDLKTFTEVFQRIKTDYVEPVDDKVLLEHAIEGMLSGLDPHSGFLTKDAYQELQVGTSGEFGGLGIEVGMESGFVKVIAPIDDTPAQRAGIKAGDLIIRLDDKPVKGMALNDAVKLMRGKPNTGIKLTILRENQEKPLIIEIIRDIIQVKSVKNRLLEPGYGYVRISHFQNHTGDDLEKALQALREQNKTDLKGLILDLRNNPGGVLNAAVAVSDVFLEDGLIVYTEGRVDDSHLQFKARPKDYLNGAPIIVLVNKGSASASEIVAGALQDHKRAIIMGSKTFGKGSVQTILPMTDDSALKLTTARYYTPSGRSIQAQGIQPDITVDKVEVAAVGSEQEEFVLGEQDLENHLSNPTESKDKTEDNSSNTLKPAVKENAGKKDEKSTAKESEEPLAKTDYTLYEALNVLKGLTIFESRKSS